MPAVATSEVWGLLRRAERAGLRVRLEGGSVVVTGPRSQEGLAREVLARKNEVAGWLARRTSADLSVALSLIDSLRCRVSGPPAFLEALNRYEDAAHDMAARNDPMLADFPTQFHEGFLARWGIQDPRTTGPKERTVS